METNLIEINDLGKRYEDFTLGRVNLAVARGSIVGLIGSNGAGKTTTLKTALGMIFADEGEVRLLGRPIIPDSKALDDIKARIGVVLDTCAFPGPCRVKDVAAIGRAAYANWDEAYWDVLVGMFKLPPKKKVSELSRGMGMKLTLAFALAHRPELLILDEATAGLDPMTRDEVLAILRDFMEDGTRGILMSTHITSDLEKIADEVACLDEGSMVFALPKDAITDEAGIAHCRTAELEAVLASYPHDLGALRVLRRSFGTDVLVPDRFAFARAFPDIAVDAASIEDYMTLMLKGESR